MRQIFRTYENHASLINIYKKIAVELYSSPENFLLTVNKNFYGELQFCSY